MRHELGIAQAMRRRLLALATAFVIAASGWLLSRRSGEAPSVHRNDDAGAAIQWNEDAGTGIDQ
jgi:hypothetical protein